MDNSLPYYSLENPHKQKLTDPRLQMNENKVSILEEKPYLEEDTT